MNYLFNIGLNDKTELKQLFGIDYYINTVGNFCPNCTITQATGFYKGMRENSLKVEVFDITEEKAEELAVTFRDVFNQECVVKTNLTTNSTVFV